MAWVYLLAAGAIEVLFALSIESTGGFTRLWPTVRTFLLGTASVYVLTHALRDLPVGTAYAVFTGIGSVGTVTLGILIAGDPVTWDRLVPLSLIVGGMVLLHLCGGR